MIEISEVFALEVGSCRVDEPKGDESGGRLFLEGAFVNDDHMTFSRLLISLLIFHSILNNP